MTALVRVTKHEELVRQILENPHLGGELTTNILQSLALKEPSFTAYTTDGRRVCVCDGTLTINNVFPEEC